MMYLSGALVIVAVLGFQGFRLWIRELQDRRANAKAIDFLEKQLEEEREAREAAVNELSGVVKMLAQDWAKKFGMIDGEWKALEERLNSQFAGVVAQSPGRGFNRG